MFAVKKLIKAAGTGRLDLTIFPMTGSRPQSKPYSHPSKASVSPYGFSVKDSDEDFLDSKLQLAISLS